MAVDAGTGSSGTVIAKMISNITRGPHTIPRYVVMIIYAGGINGASISQITGSGNFRILDATDNVSGSIHQRAQPPDQGQSS